VNWALIRSVSPPEVPKPFDFGMIGMRIAPTSMAEAAMAAAAAEVVSKDVCQTARSSSSASSSYVDLQIF
jgi:hypothetical protein